MSVCDDCGAPWQPPHSEYTCGAGEPGNGRMRYWLPFKQSPTIKQLVVLAAERTGQNVMFRKDDHNNPALAAVMGSIWCSDATIQQPFWDELQKLQDTDAMSLIDVFTVTSVRHELMLLAQSRTCPQGVLDIRESFRDKEPVLEIWVSANNWDSKAFYAEFERLEELVKTPLNEPILEDDYPIYGGRMYVVDGIPRECEYFKNEANAGITAAEAKRRFGVAEIRRCDITGRQNRLPARPAVAVVDKRAGRWDASGRTIVQHKRKPRNSNKIKKVK